MIHSVFYSQDGVSGGSAESAPAAVAATTAQSAPVAAPAATGQISPEDKLINDKIAAGTAKEVAKYLKDAGLDPSGNTKEDLAKFKAWKESQMTEAEKLKAANETTTAERDAAKAEAETARYEAAAARLGVPDDKIDSFVRYAKVSDGDTPAERMKNYLDSVGFKRPVAGQAFGGATTGQGVDANTAALNVIRNAMK